MKKFVAAAAVLSLLLPAFSACAPALPPADTDSGPAAPDTTPAETTAAEEPADIPVYFDPAAYKEADLPAHYEKRTVKPTSVTPVIDGILTEEEWGEPDYRLNAEITGGERTYCRDYYAGKGQRISDTEYYWRYDGKYIYLAMRVAEPAYDSPAADIVYEGDTRTLEFNFGGVSCTVIPENGKIVSLYGTVCAAYTEKDGVRFYEFAMPREKVIGTEWNSFLGFVENKVGVHFFRNSTQESGTANICTRTTPVYQTDAFTHDVFYLAAGTPAPAPNLSVPEAPAADEEIELKLSSGHTLHFSEPVILEQGPPGDQIWGHYQFPSFTRYSDGSILAAWSYGRDTILPSGDRNPKGANHSVSKDNGKTWQFGASDTITGYANELPMKNGKYFTGFVGAAAYKTDYLDKYTPAITWSNGKYKMFFAENIEEQKDITVRASEYDPATGKTTTFDVKINWPYMPLVQFPDKVVYPVTKMFNLSNGSVMSVDGDLYISLYFHGFNSFAESPAEVIPSYCNKYSMFFLRSTDNGRTWDLISQLMTDENITKAAEGLCEAEMTVLPDGSFVTVMRTGGNNPSWISRSTDKGETWSKPEQFDYIGVLPQLCTLECGVTLSSYGRPTMRFAATADPDGANWEHFDFPVTGGYGQSCFYTDLLPIGENTALFLYTDFMFPNEDGAPVKTVLVRTVTVIPE